jgi:outer membrane protein TolC
MATLSFSIPLWYGKYGAETREAQKRFHAIQNERSAKENNLIVQLKLAYYHFIDAQNKMDLYQNKLITKAEKSLSVAQKAFASGMGSFLEVIEAQETLLEFRLANERASVDYAQSVAALEKIVGRELPPAVQTMKGDIHR